MPYVLRFCFLRISTDLFLLFFFFNIRRMYATTWLERLFQSCQRKSNHEPLEEDQFIQDHHRLLSYEQLPNFGNDGLV